MVDCTYHIDICLKKPNLTFCIHVQRGEKIPVPLKLSPRVKKCWSLFIKYDQQIVITGFLRLRIATVLRTLFMEQNARNGVLTWIKHHKLLRTAAFAIFSLLKVFIFAWRIFKIRVSIFPMEYFFQRVFTNGSSLHNLWRSVDKNKSHKNKYPYLQEVFKFFLQACNISVHTLEDHFKQSFPLAVNTQVCACSRIHWNTWKA